jgi:hypothetical protein
MVCAVLCCVVLVPSKGENQGCDSVKKRRDAEAKNGLGKRADDGAELLACAVCHGVTCIYHAREITSRGRLRFFGGNRFFFGEGGECLKPF